MASVIYDEFFKNLALGNIDWDTDDIRCALVDSTYTPICTDTQWYTGKAPYVDEITGDAYTAGGVALAGGTVTVATALTTIDGDDVTWATSTITARCAVLFDSTMADKDLIACFQFTEDKSSANGDFTIQWNASGIMTLQQS